MRVPYAAPAVRHLKRADPVLQRVIERVGPCRLQVDRDHFGTLAKAIIFQQLAVKAAQTIFRRYQQLYGKGRNPRPAELARTPRRRLRAAGLSRQKMAYLQDLARNAARGELGLGRFRRIEDEEVIERLTRVKGIGRWTAEMFLIFSLGRPDVLPVDDLGFQLALKKAYRLRKLPSAEKIKKLAEPWRPYRSVATWYLWQVRRIDLRADLRG
ncbi:MAG: DNA-3-methyladenine glycosylase family protein [Terriglobia bacterium]